MYDTPGVIGVVNSEKVSPALMSFSDVRKALPATALADERIRPPNVTCCPTDNVKTARCVLASGFEQLSSEKFRPFAWPQVTL